MEYQYTIEEITTICGISNQAAYGFIKKNKEFVDGNSMRVHRRVKYNDAVLKMFTDYYQDRKQEINENSAEYQETIKQLNEQVQQYETELEEVQKERDQWKGECKLLQDELDRAYLEIDKKEKEVAELLKQNGLALLILQQEKQEKQQLLPRVEHGLFSWLFGHRTRKEQ